MSNGNWLYRCEQNGCFFFAVVQIRRGQSMPYIRLCPSHRNQFHELTNADAATVSDERQVLPPIAISSTARFGRA